MLYEVITDAEERRRGRGGTGTHEAATVHAGRRGGDRRIAGDALEEGGDVDAGVTPQGTVDAAVREVVGVVNLELPGDDASYNFV